jgi:tetraacyldisaccharide 4'-kinase
VGNIQAGGAGKTPLVAAIAREAAERGITACILCRGYGGEWERSGGVLHPGTPAPEARICGDEAALLHDLAPLAVIGVGADRVAQWERTVSAVRARGLEIGLVILDDGFQHWKIKKDVEVVALTSFGPGEVAFRDSRRALEKADLLVWTKGERRPPMPEAKPWTRVRYRLAPPRADQRGIWLVTGVADGKSVEELVRLSGYQVDRHISFPDHARYAEVMVQELVKNARRAGVGIAVTGKDWVKWREIAGVREGVGPGLVMALEPELEWQEGREKWNRALWGS